MQWGILFRRQISLTYARIQDIHLASNFVERWLGLARVEVQTASGKSQAELTIEGVREYEELRDFLYLRMRGARGLTGETSEPAVNAESGDPLVEVLEQVASEIREMRLSLERRG